MKQLDIILCFLLLVLSLPHETSAHSGRTDSYGGHNKTDDGTYHCHSGECLEDAWESTYKTVFPIGQEDGRKGENRYEEYEDILHNRVLTGEIDDEKADYLIPYTLKAYKMGYEDTYVPTFWEKVWETFKENPLYILFGLGILIFWVIPIIYNVFHAYRNNCKNKISPNSHKKDH
ncbi:YHYH domain-containing protein [Bacillus cihuensis]|uniref:YHYH domain-containing protein n=1 Tax=Bacillus cihuensis TaxID=1208599 RepID=UPI00040A03F3|nr:YHYH domain-containing protein [Bacillus cihuensis]